MSTSSFSMKRPIFSASSLGPMTTLLSSLVRRLILLGGVFSLTSCGLVFEAIGITARRSREIPIGTVLTGDGFSLRCPEDGLYPTRNLPTTGGVTLRSTMSDFPVTSFVTPFRSLTARSTDQALQEWNQRVIRNRQSLVVLQQSHTTYGGMPATRAVINFPQKQAGHIAAMLVVRRSNDFLIIANGRPYYTQPGMEGTISICEKELSTLQHHTSITQR